MRDGRRAKLHDTVQLLKTERELRGLSLSDIEEKTGISKSAISKLENNDDANPTVSTLSRYAEALGMTLSVVLTEKS